METEAWKAIPGYPQHEVSDMGRVRGPQGLRALNMQNAGYQVVTLTSQPGATKTVHRLVCEAFLGPIPKGWCTNHKNGIKTDNRLANLEYVTRSQNNYDHLERVGKRATRKPLNDDWPRGEDHPRAKLSEQQVLGLHAMLAGGMNRREIAAKTGICYWTVRDILNGRSWAYLHPDPLLRR